MTIRTRLNLLLALSIIGILYLAADAFWRARNVESEMSDLVSVIDLTVATSDFVHESQKERGATALFLGSNRERFHTELKEQRAATDLAFDNLMSLLDGFDRRSANTTVERLYDATSKLKELQNIRIKIDNGNIETSAALGYYTKRNGELLDSIGNATRASSSSAIGVSVAAYLSFLKGKERAGIERAVLCNAFAKNEFDAGMYRKFISLVTLQESYFQDFKLLASEQEVRFFNDSMQADCVAEVERFRQLAFERAYQSELNADPKEWFAVSTDRINILKEVGDHLASELAASANQTKSRATNRCVFLAVVGISLAAFTCIGSSLVIRSIRNSISFVSQALGRIADGDLTQQVPVSKDELGAVAQRVNVVVGSLGDVISELKVDAMQLDESSTLLSASSDELANEAQNATKESSSVAAAAEEMTLNMSTMSETTTSVSDDVKQVAVSIQELKTSVQEIAQNADRSAEDAKGAAKLAQSSFDKVNALGDAASEIGKVSEVIEDIAEKTNLLALNATIEAARAGEAGKGFSIVASEVKVLSTQTAEATDDIRNRIEQIQNSTATAVQSIGEITKVIEDAKLASNTIAAAVEQQSATASQIADRVESSVASLDNLALGVGDSATVSRDVSKSIAHVDQVLRRTSSTARESRDSGQRFSRIASKINESTSQFTTAE